MFLCSFEQNIVLYFFPILMALAWMVFVITAIRSIVFEKETKLFEVILSMLVIIKRYLRILHSKNKIALQALYKLDTCSEIFVMNCNVCSEI